MTKRRAFVITYEQWLEQDTSLPGWSEKSEISIRLTSDALTSGWITGFGKYPIDYLVLSLIGLHARPLADKDIELLGPSGIVTAEDRGRMFSYITDAGLADLLGKDRQTIADSATRLAADEHLTIRKLDRDAQIRLGGRFNGNKLYILSGNVALRKEMVRRENIGEETAEDGITDRAGFSSTVDAPLEPTVRDFSTRSAATVRSFPAPPAGFSRTNLNTLVVVDAAEPEHIFDFRDEAVFGHFAARKGKPYKPTGNDRKALRRVREAGYSLQQITAAIDEPFDRGDNPTTFAYCARVVEDYRPARLSPASPATPATPATPAPPAMPATPGTSAPPALLTVPAAPALPATPAKPAPPAMPATPATIAPPADLPEEIKALATTIAPHLPERDPSAGSGQAPSALPPSGVAELALRPQGASKGQAPLAILRHASRQDERSGQALPSVGHRLMALADSCAEAARQHGTTGTEWLRDALLRSVGKDDPLAYAAAILRAWTEHGPAADFRPTRDGYHPPRRDSAAAPAASADANGDDGDSDPYRVIDPPLLPLPEK